MDCKPPPLWSRSRIQLNIEKTLADIFLQRKIKKLLAIKAAYPYLIWPELAEKFNSDLQPHAHRSTRALRERYNNYLRPSTTYLWTEDQEQKLRKLVDTLGCQWHLIALHFPFLTVLDIKIKFNLLKKEDDEKWLKKLSEPQNTQISEPTTDTFDTNWQFDDDCCDHYDPQFYSPDWN